MAELRRVEGGGFELLLDAGGRPLESYRCELSTCDSPFCSCRTITLTFGQYALHLDPFERLQDPEGTEVNPRQREFGDTVAAGLSEDSWRLLAAAFLHAKERAFETLDPDDVALDLPFEEVEHESLLLRYRDVFPFATALALSVDDKDYLVSELYCPRESCACTRAVLVPSAIEGRTAREGRAVTFDYATGIWTDEQAGAAPSGTLRALCDAMDEQNPDLRDTLRRHHDTIRRIYRSSKSKLDDTRPVETNASRSLGAIGRNAPCPCGSGRKHKRCCGNPGLRAQDSP